MLKLHDADVFVTKVSTNHRAWATCGISTCHTGLYIEQNQHHLLWA